MNKAALAVIGGLALLAAGAWYISTSLSQTTLSPKEETEIRAFVAEFGTKLQFVPLLATTTERQTAMELYYGPYVAPELLLEWYPEGAPQALGRYSSSPWPERIEVVLVQKLGRNSYTVEGNVIEVTSAEAGAGKAAAAVYPLTLDIEKRDGGYVIVQAIKGAYSTVPQRVTLAGFWECVPIKRGYPQTEECVRGIALDQSDGHVIVNTMLMSQMPAEYDPGTKVRVQGVLVPASQLSTDQWQKYDIDGILSATVIEEAN